MLGCYARTQDEAKLEAFVVAEEAAAKGSADSGIGVSHSWDVGSTDLGNAKKNGRPGFALSTVLDTLISCGFKGNGVFIIYIQHI